MYVHIVIYRKYILTTSSSNGRSGGSNEVDESRWSVGLITIVVTGMKNNLIHSTDSIE